MPSGHVLNKAATASLLGLLRFSSAKGPSARSNEAEQTQETGILHAHLHQEDRGSLRGHDLIHT